VILGAAILDDVIGLVILTVVAELSSGRGVSASGVARTTASAFGLLAVTVLVGRRVVPRLAAVLSRSNLPGSPTILALILAFGLGWLADRAGSAAILGAFAAGLLIVGTPRAHEIEQGVTRLGNFFVPLFFVMVGAEVDVSVLNPLDPANHRTLAVAGVLTLVAVAGKFAAGYAPFWFKGRKAVVGAGMVPRGEVGLIFAQMGRSGGVLDPGLFTALTLVVMITTFLAPPMLKALLPDHADGPQPADYEGIEDLATEG
jgi:Kef-type K+ transport system membrane component KefB